MKIEVDAEDLLALLLPHLERRDMIIMAAIDDLQNSVTDLKAAVTHVASTLGDLASKLHSHPAANNDAIIESVVGDMNTLSATLNNAVGATEAAETGSVLDDSAGQTPPPATDPNAGDGTLVSGSDSKASQMSAGDSSTAQADGSVDTGASDASSQLLDVTAEPLGQPIDVNA